MPETAADLAGPVNGDEPDIRAVALPNGARMAFTIQVAIEAWAENDPPDWTAISSHLYGPRTGMARLTETIEEQGVRSCVHISALLAERWPDLVAGLHRNGHEIVGHGYAQDQPMAAMDEATDLAVVRKCAEVIDQVTGQRPAGWSSHGSRRGAYTILSLLKEGYTYTRDFRDSDLPYVAAQLGERRLLAMPRTDEINDLPISNRHGLPPSVYVELFKRSFDQLYAEGGKAPTCMTCVTHAYVSGKPWGASAVAECLKYVRSHEKVWIATGREVAEHYLAQLPSLSRVGA
ncbi:MAG TPA: polysaccharide deacetylase family protein [Chloroflexota bacterium]|nr:polysaccharide deacetylase family protein [Chloroflexota bacterium]